MLDPVKNERGLVMVAALGIIVVLSGLSLVVVSSGQMSTLTGALTRQAAKAFHVADGGAYYALGEAGNFNPDMAARVVDHSATEAAIGAIVTAEARGRRSLPGNLMIRTTDGKLRMAQFGQGEGLGQMFFFRLRSDTQSGEGDPLPWASVRIEAAKLAPCPDCGA